MRIAPILAVLALAAAGCSSSTSKPAAAPAPPPAATSAPAAPASSSRPAAPASTTAAALAKLKVGATAVLTTPTGPLEVTLVKVVDPAKPAESYIYPESGHHWIGLQLRFVNKGTAAFVDSPMLGLDAADAQGQPMGSFPDQDIAAGPMIDPLAGVHIQPGNTLLAYLVYSLADGTKMARWGFAPPGSSSAQWTLS